jgi:arylformamidase
MNNTYIDLSHTIFDGLVTYKGLPAPVICDYLSREYSKKFYEKGTQFQIGKIELVANTGTYIDCPFHRYENGKDLSEVELKNFVDLNAKDITEIGVKYFKGKDVTEKAVLVFTDWAKYWDTEKYFETHPYITKEAAEYLKDQKVILVGIDSHNIGDTKGKSHPVHSILLGSEILIVEHICNLDKLPKSGYTFSAVPPKFKGVGTFPVRAFAKIKKN